MSVGLVDGLLSVQPDDPAGPGMRVVMIDRKNIITNPDNRKIYRIGDVSRLKEDIKTNGIRQPLEVVDLADGNYKLIGGERRLTACKELAKEGDTRFEALPCVILKFKHGDDEKIALITANATARDLTDGERLAQYETLKEILTRRKSLGGLNGKVRDELCRILGLSTGAAARLNAISENCGDDTKRELQAGEITLMGAYRRAQEIIAERMAQQEAAKAPKPDEPVYEKPVVFDCKPESSVTIPKSNKNDDEFETDREMEKAGKLPEWAYAQAAEICRDDWTKYISEFSGEGIRKSKIMEYTNTGHPLKCGGYVHYTSATVCISVLGTHKIELPWGKFADACKEVGIAPTLKPVESEKTNQPKERGCDTLRKLAEKELSQKALWTFDRNLFIYQLDFYKHSLPGGAELYRMEDSQKDEHTRYAIILQDYKFFTSGWEPYEEAIESLVRYLNMK